MAYELQEKELAMIEETQQHSLIYRQFIDKVKDSIDNDVEINFADLKKFAKQFGVPDDNYSIIINLAELAIVEYCSLKNEREWPNKSDREAYEELKHIYQIQPKITTKDGQAKLLQQYSTPCPIAWLMGKYVINNGSDNKSILEPSAGNGMLTIGLRHDRCYVNDLDEIRFHNLELQDYPIKYMEVTNLNARELPYPDKSFDCVVTNPPFQKIERNFMSRKGRKGDHTITYDFKKLDHELAILALDKMKDSGRCAIIVGGNIDYETHEKNVYWDKDGRFKNGAFKTFVSYLHRQYNIEDIIYINGDMYKKQGTNFPIILLLINGRKEWDSAPTTRWHDYDESLDKQINTFDALFERVYKHIGGKAEGLGLVSYTDFKVGDWVSVPKSEAEFEILCYQILDIDLKKGKATLSWHYKGKTNNYKLSDLKKVDIKVPEKKLEIGDTISHLQNRNLKGKVVGYHYYHRKSNSKDGYFMFYMSEYNYVDVCIGNAIPETLIYELYEPKYKVGDCFMFEYMTFVVYKITKVHDKMYDYEEFERETNTWRPAKKDEDAVRLDDETRKTYNPYPVWLLKQDLKVGDWVRVYPWGDNYYQILKIIDDDNIVISDSSLTDLRALDNESYPKISLEKTDREISLPKYKQGDAIKSHTDDHRNEREGYITSYFYSNYHKSMCYHITLKDNTSISLREDQIELLGKNIALLAKELKMLAI